MRAVLYLRVSTEKQAERDLSLPNQRLQIEAFCAREGLSIVGEYSDAGASARSARRISFQKMISAAGQHPRPFDAVVVYNWSRFFRDATEALFYIRKLERLDVRVRAVTQDVTDDASGRLLRTILAATDEHASEMIGERTLGGMEENIRQGFVNGRPPYGFRSVECGRRGDKIKKKFEHDPADADVVRTIFRLYVHGDGSTGPIGIKKIVEYLNGHGYQQRTGKAFSVNYVHTILRNTVYAGKYIWNKTDCRTRQIKPESEWVTFAVPAIVDQSLFDAAQSRLINNQPRRTPSRIVNSPILLSGLIRCEHCGRAMTRGAGKGHRYYMCSGKNRQGSAICKGQYLPMGLVDEAVTEGIIGEVLEPQRLTEMFRKVQERERTSTNSLGDAKAALQREQKAVQVQIDRLINAVANGLLDQDEHVRSQMDERKSQLAEISRRLGELDQRKPIALTGVTDQKLRSFARALTHMLRHGEAKFRQSYLRVLIEKIDVADGVLKVFGSQDMLAMAASSFKAGPDSVNASVQEWRAVGDSNLSRRRLAGSLVLAS